MTSEAASTHTRPADVAGILFVNVATLTWAVNIALGRWMRSDIGPITAAALRFSMSSALLYLLLRRQPVQERRLGRDRWLLVVMGLSGVTLFAPVLFFGLRYTTALNATLINGMGPLITGVLAALLIQEPMSRRQVAGALLALAGIVVLISGGRPDFWRELGRNVGDLVLLGGISLWAVYSVVGRRVMRYRSALSTTAFSSFLGLPLLLLGAVWEVQVIPVDWSPQLLLAMLYVGIMPTVIGVLAWNEGVRRLGASGAMVFYNTLPFYGALVGIFFLGEKVGPAHLLGGALIIGGGIYAAWGRAAPS